MKNLHWILCINISYITYGTQNHMKYQSDTISQHPTDYSNWMPSNIIVNSELELEQINPEHIDSVFNLVRENKEHLSRWLGWVNNTRDPKDTARFITYAQEQYKKRSMVTYTIKNSHEILGLIDIKNVNWNTKTACFGYWLGQKALSRGIVTLSCGVLINHVFKTFKLNQLQIHCASGNDKSAGVAKRLGFNYVETVKNAENVNGAWLDHDIYILERS